MRYCNSLLVVRTITVFVSVLVVRDYHLLVKSLFHLYYSLRHTFDYVESSSTPAMQEAFSWDDVELLSPPALNDSLAEALRLNELLARPQYKCNKVIRIGSEHFGFLICYDAHFTDNNSTIGEALLLSGDVFEDASFAKSLNPKRWTMFIPENYAALDQLADVDVEVNYLMRLRDAEDWNLDGIIDGIANKQFHSAFFSFYSPLISRPENGGIDQLLEAPKFIAKLLPFLNAKQLQIVVKIEKEKAPYVILEWYRLLYRLFFKYNFALLGAEADGNCGRMLDKCKYRLSFVHFEGHAFEAPVFGFGSPLEERNRLIRYLKSVDAQSSCTVNSNCDLEVPVFCKVTTVHKEKCVVVYISYRDLTSAEALQAFSGCELYYFSPLQLIFKFDASVHIFQFGLSPRVNESISVPGDRDNEQWELLTFTEIVEKTGRQQVDVLILDLNGGEWDVMEAILSSPNELKKIQQISMRLRLWIGEENENCRRFYYRLMQLNDMHFRKPNWRSRIPDMVWCASSFDADEVLKRSSFEQIPYIVVIIIRAVMRAIQTLVPLMAILNEIHQQVMAIDFSASIYQFTVLDADGKEVSLKKYRGKVLLIVNVASQCGLTNSNYHQMKVLLDKYKSQGFEIAAFPCNQFASQEPNDEAHIKRFIKETFDFEPDLYAKINVNGAEEHPLFTYLKHQQGGTIIDAIKWNFTKFLVDRYGRVVQRYAPTTQPMDIENDIRELLNNRSDL